jgi:hypothetical protein
MPLTPGLVDGTMADIDAVAASARVVEFFWGGPDAVHVSRGSPN